MVSGSPGKAFGIAIFGQNLSPLVMSPLAAYLVSRVGLSNTFVTIGILVFVLLYLIGFAFWKVPPAERREGYDFTLKQAIRDRRFWILFTVMYSTAFGWFLILLNIATIIVEGLVDLAGMNAEYVLGTFVPMFMGVTAIGNAFGGLIWGFVNDRIGGPMRTLPIVYSVGGVAIVLLMLTYAEPLLLLPVGFILYFALGGEPTIHFSAVPTFFGREAIGRITTILNTSVFTSAIVGPYIGAYLKDVTGTYLTALMLAAILHFFATAVVLIGKNMQEVVLMFKFENQKVFEIGGVKIGGEVGENPTVLIGSIFYGKHKIVEDEKKGLFDREKAEAIIKEMEELSDKTGNPGLLDVVG